jgi:TRAP-type C4-dicarboxylate transport system permease small subunit
MHDRTRLPFGMLATTATILSLVSCYATRIELWIPSLHEPIQNWVNIHVQAAVIVATAAAAVVGLMLDRKHHRSATPSAVGCAGFVLIA